MTTYHLANDGCKDEDLFAMLACLLCMISVGFDSTNRASILITTFVEADAMDVECKHQELSAAELAS